MQQIPLWLYEKQPQHSAILANLCEKHPKLFGKTINKVKPIRGRKLNTNSIYKVNFEGKICLFKIVEKVKVDKDCIYELCKSDIHGNILNENQIDSSELRFFN